MISGYHSLTCSGRYSEGVAEAGVLEAEAETSSLSMASASEPLVEWQTRGASLGRMTEMRCGVGA